MRINDNSPGKMNRITGKAKDATLIEMSQRDSHIGGRLDLLYHQTQKRPAAQPAQVRWAEKNLRSLATWARLLFVPEETFPIDKNAQ